MMTDNELIDWLRAELDEFTANPPSAPHRAVGRARGLNRPARVWMAAAAVVLVAAAGALVVRRHAPPALVPISAADVPVTAVMSPTVSPNTITVASTTGSSTSVETPPAATEPITDVSYYAIGESVMLGAAPEMSARGIVVDAAIARSPDEARAALVAFLATHRITGGVVMQMGTNGTVSRQQYEALLAPLTEVPLVVVLTVKAPKPWIDANNQIIRSLPATHPNVLVVDWEARATEIPHQLTSSDGVHLATAAAKQFYTELILEALGVRH